MYCRTANYGYPSVWSFGGASVVENQQVGCACLDAVNRSFIYFCSCLFLSLILNIASVGTGMTVLRTWVPVVCRVVPGLCVTLLCCYPVCQTVMGYSISPLPPSFPKLGKLARSVSHMRDFCCTTLSCLDSYYVALLVYTGWWILSNTMKWTIRRQLGCSAIACWEQFVGAIPLQIYFCAEF